MPENQRALFRFIVTATGVAGASIGVIVGAGAGIVSGWLLDSLNPGAHFPTVITLGMVAGVVGAFIGATYGISYSRKFFEHPRR
jgi:hypothetical protein